MTINSMSTLPLKDEIRRDRYGRAMVVPPGGGKLVPYTRVTTVAKALDVGGGLAPWLATMTAVGLMSRPGLRAQWESLIAGTGGDPYYYDKDTKKKCIALVDDCAAVGGANDRREMGDALHFISALTDTGRAPATLTDETVAMMRTYTEGLAAAGITLVPGAVEMMVVLDEFRVSGSFDRLAMVPGFRLPLIADLKTGHDLGPSWRSISVQLAGYSRANDLYRQGLEPDGSLDQRAPFPEVDQDWGLVIHLNAGTGDLELYLVNLRVGWDGFLLSLQAREWRKEADDVAMPLREFRHQPADGDYTPLLEASIARLQPPPALTPPPALSARAAEQIGVYQVRAVLQERIDQIGQDPDARQALASSWPAGLPTLRGSDAHTPAQLAQIEQILSDVEGRADRAVGLVLQLFPGATMTNDNDKDDAS